MGMKSPLRILYLEDNPADAGFVQTTLEADGLPCELELVDNREDFLSALEEGRYDILLADFFVPSFDGSSALTLANEKCPGTPFIVVSAFLGEERAVKLLKRGATDFVPKQRLSRLAPSVRRALREVQERTERIQAEQALQEAERKYRGIFENAVEGIFQSTPDGRFLSVNPAMARMLGYGSPDELVRSVANIEHQLYTDPGRRTELMSLLDRGGVLQQFESQLLRRDGSPIWVSENVRAVRDQNGTVIYYEGTLEDITERKRADDALRKSEAKYRKLVEQIPAVTYVEAITDKGETPYVSPQIQTLLGYSQAEPSKLRQDWFGKIHPDDRDRVAAEFQRSRAEGRPFACEYRIKTHQGDILWLSDEATCVYDDSGKPLFMQGLLFDITERKRAEEALRESERKYRALVDNALVGVFKTNIRGDIIYVNEALSEMFEFDSPEEMTGSGVLTRYRNPEDRHMLIEGLRKTGHISNHEVDCLTKHGNSRTILINAALEGDIISGMILDITKRKQAEEALAWAESKYRTIFDNAIEGIYQSTPDGRFITANPTLASMLGYENPDELKNSVQNIETQLYTDQKRRSEFRALVEHRGSVEGFESRLRRKDGSAIWISENARAVRDRYGEIKYYEGTLQDITQRKEAELALKESENKYRQLVEQAVDGIFIANRDGTILLANQKSCEMLGYAENELLQLNIEDTYPPEEKYLARRRMSELQPGKSMHFERRVRKKDGTFFPAEVDLRMLVDSKFQGVIRDISEKKQAEESIQKLLRAIEQTDEVIFMTDIDGTITYVNPAFEKVYGFTRDAAVGKNPRILKSGLVSQQEYSEYWQTILSGRNVRKEYINRTMDGKLVTVDASVSPIFSTQGKLSGFIAVQKDITEQKRAEEQRKSLEMQLLQSQKIESVGTLAGGIAHDFNNILGIILGHATVLERAVHDPSRSSKSVEAIIKAVQRGANLVRQILTFARKTDVFFEAVSVNDTITELVKMLEETFPKTITFVVQLQQAAPLIEADRTQLHQTMLNLCVNARDAMPEGGTITIITRTVPVTTLRRRFPDAAAAEFICIRVSDTGVGMDEQTKRRIFEPFFTTKGLGKGTGLGLAVAYGIMESHNGYIDVESDPGVGTTFSLYLPVPAAQVASTDRQDERFPEIEGGSETILLVEDEEMLRDLVRALLESKGYTLLTAEDGEDALRVYAERRNEIALVLSDVGLPKLGGADVFLAMKRINPGVKVILASGYVEPTIKAELLKAGARAFVQKPYQPNEILKKVRDLLDESKNGS
jgi:PAS domain S-box-containing protein